MLEGISDNPLNGIICSSDLLLDYVRRNYPKMPVKLSVIRSYMEKIWSLPERDIVNWHRQMFDKYDSISLNPNLNKSYGIIEKLPLDRLEIMVSLFCEYRCPHSDKHYEASARANLFGREDWGEIEYDLGYCAKKKPRVEGMTLRTVQLCNDTIKTLRSLGVKYFKIHGKSDSYWDLAFYFNHYILNPHGIHVDWHYHQGNLSINTRTIGREEFDV